MPVARSAPNSNFVSARMRPRASAISDAWPKISSESSRSCSATTSPDELDRALVRDVHVVLAQGRLPGGGVDRLGQAVAVLEPLGQRDAADRARLLVLLPAAAREVAAHDALDGEHVERAAQRRAIRDLGGDVGQVERLEPVVEVMREVVRHLGKLVEPPAGELGEHLALARDRGLEHLVVGAHPVARDDEHDRREPTDRRSTSRRRRAVCRHVQVAHLARVDVRSSRHSSARVGHDDSSTPRREPRYRCGTGRHRDARGRAPRRRAARFGEVLADGDDVEHAAAGGEQRQLASSRRGPMAVAACARCTPGTDAAASSPRWCGPSSGVSG